MRYLSVCAGIEAATVAWHPLGWEAAAFSEIEAFPRAVLAHHYPDVPLHGDFTTIGADDYGAIDLLVGGTPCQSFSIAGLRGGLDDDRGNLALEFLRLAKRKSPKWLVWENVPGVLSSNGGRDFGAILGGMVELGYGFAYRVLDAQFFGVPQRRRRVFVVGCFGDWRPAAAVLFERHSMSGHPAPSREARKEAARAALSGAEERGGRGGYGIAVNISNGEPRLAEVTGTLDCWSMKGRGSSQQQAVLTGAFVPDTANAITASLANSATGHNKDENVIASDAYNQAETEGVSKTVAARNDQDTASCVAFAQNTRDEVRIVGGDGQISGALAAQPGMKQTTYIAFSAKDYGADAMSDCSPTLRAVSENLENGPQGKGYQEGVAYTLEARNNVQSVAATAVRRLTPVECERLQGFPDNYTAIPWRGKDAENCSDGPRYKALGNSMAVPVMRWIGQRIDAVEKLQHKELAA